MPTLRRLTLAAALFAAAGVATSFAQLARAPKVDTKSGIFPLAATPSPSLAADTCVSATDSGAPGDYKLSVRSTIDVGGVAVVESAATPITVKSIRFDGRDITDEALDARRGYCRPATIWPWRSITSRMGRGTIRNTSSPFAGTGSASCWVNRGRRRSHSD
jgi:hypothetical protein